MGIAFDVTEKPSHAYGVTTDARFTLHQRQPRSNKLDARQRTLCANDPAYAEALSKRVSNPARFSAFLARSPYYITLDAPCPRCERMKRRTRDRSCYTCHLAWSGSNFERITAGLAPMVGRSLDGYRDQLERRIADKRGDHLARQFGDINAKLWPMGRLEVTYGDGYVDPDLSRRSWQECMNALEIYPGLRDVLRWAGWSVD